MRYTTKTLITISIVLLLISTYSIYYKHLQLSRILRLTTATSFFIFFLLNKGYKYYRLLFVFICFIISDAFMLFYENIILNKLTSLVTIIGYLTLISIIIKKVQIKNLNKYIISFFIVLILFNLFKLHSIINTISHVLLDFVQESLLYIYGISLISICALSVNYNFKENTKKSTYFMLTAFSITLSDLCAFIGYYHKIYSIYYADRIFYILSFYFLVRYTLQLSQKEDKPLILE
jgi:hypothetical protein